MHAMTCVANASLISTASRSATSQPAARERPSRVEGTGPRPMMCGGTPAEAEATIRARGVRPWRSTRLAAGDDDRRGAVGERRRAAGGHDAVGLEGGLELGQRLGAGVRARHLVRGDLALAGLDRPRSRAPAARVLAAGELLRAQAPGVGVLAADAVEDRDLLGRLAQADGRLAAVEVLQPRVDEPPAERGVGHVAGGRPRPRALGHDHRRAGHRLDAAGDDDVGLAGCGSAARRRRRPAGCWRTGG